ncbi:MAG: hypothetical protein ACTSPW_00165 [Promethearchaeota archaeon]
MESLPPYMKGEIYDLLRDILDITIRDGEDFIGFLKKIDKFIVLLLIKLSYGNAVDLKMLENASEPIEILVAQALHPSLLYIYSTEKHMIAIYGMGIKKSTCEVKIIEVYENSRDLIMAQYNGERIPFDFEPHEIIGYTDKAIIRLLEPEKKTPFRPIIEEEARLIKRLYDDYFKCELSPEKLIKNEYELKLFKANQDLKNKIFKK